MPDTPPLPSAYNYLPDRAAPGASYATAEDDAHSLAQRMAAAAADADAAAADSLVEAALDELGPPEPDEDYEHPLPIDDTIPTLAYPNGKANTKSDRLSDHFLDSRPVHHADMTAEDVEDVHEAHTRIRRPEPGYPTDHNVWIADNHVTGTELSLRLALYLLEKNLVISDVHVALTGYELSRNCSPRFPVASYLCERGFAPVQQALRDWRTTYMRRHPPTPYATKDDAGFAIELSNSAATPDLVARLTSGATLRAYVSRGLLVSTRSPAEHKLLRGAIGRAITCESAERGDILAAVVPRSKRFRELAVRWRQTECALRARLLILTVDRAGNVDGLQRDA